jgi:hypothetical protein
VLLGISDEEWYKGVRLAAITKKGTGRPYGRNWAGQPRTTFCSLTIQLEPEGEVLKRLEFKQAIYFFTIKVRG